MAGHLHEARSLPSQTLNTTALWLQNITESQPLPHLHEARSLALQPHAHPKLVAPHRLHHTAQH